MLKITFVILMQLLPLPVVLAQQYPSRPITLVIPFGTGGINDTVARPLAALMSKNLGQPVLVDNRAGAGGAIGMGYVAKQKPDGYTLLLATPNISVIPEAEKASGKKPSYAVSDFTPIAMIFADPLVLLTQPDSPISSLSDFIAMAKAKPGKISYSSSGLYGNSHIAMAMVEQAAGIKVLQVPYKGGGPAVLALMGAEVDLSGQASGTMKGQLSTGKIRPLAVWGRERLPSAPNIPTFLEQGIDAEFYIWNILFAPAGMPADTLNVLRMSIKAAVNDPSFKKMMANIDLPIKYMDGTELDNYVLQDALKFTKVITRLGRD